MDNGKCVKIKQKKKKSPSYNLLMDITTYSPTKDIRENYW